MDVFRASQGIAFLALLVFTAACSDNRSRAVELVEKPAGDCSESAVQNKFVIRWKNGSTTKAAASDREALIRELIEPNLNQTEFAEHDYVVTLNDPEPKPQPEDKTDGGRYWGQYRTHADVAWNAGITGESIVVAVIDSGATVGHPQLRNRLAINEGEAGAVDSDFCRSTGSGLDECRKEKNRIDDDGNGLIDDVHGFDFYANSGDVTDGTGHGTHVAGIILADHVDKGAKGIAYSAKLLPLDFMNDGGSGHVSDAIRAIYYAASRGARIINASWGGAPCSKALQKAISDVGLMGVLFVAASGNGDSRSRGINLDFDPTFPAAYVLPNQITVGASTIYDNMAGFSNYGLNTVHILAPGTEILSTYKDDGIAFLDGTSMATPFVSGAAALLWSFRPQASVEDVRTAILSSVDVNEEFAVSTKGQLNIEAALKAISAMYP